ncbi:MAG: hypothetical protein IJP39_07600 [Bacteroidales bacterium]|nr:hypothetical protein [Bacteroidales bacterium]
MGTYGFDADFLTKHGIETLELVDGDSRVMIIPAWQGRVQTSTTGGLNGPSYGWTNHPFIEKGELSDQINPFGGEERFWIGPEGGPFSWYFKKGDEQVYENWKVPAFINSEAFDVESKNEKEVVLSREFDATNASGIKFKIGVKRTVKLVSRVELEETLGIKIPGSITSLAYKSENTLFNRSGFEWTKETGMPSVWILGSYNPTPSTTVFIPSEKSFSSRRINDEYFGKVPADRLVYDDWIFYFKIDGKYRSKIGLPAGSAKDVCGSYDSQSGLLNILKYTVPEGPADYVNGQWGPQEDPYGGDVINSYNDGPTETGFIQGPFYEIETSSPGAALAPGGSLTHVQYTIHLTGPKEDLSAIAEKIFGVRLEKIVSVFK